MMNKFTKIITILGVLANSSLSINAQTKTYTVADAHSHNDYKNNIPFLRAYEKGFGSVEADVYAVNGKLMVAHDKKDINPKRSLQLLYIDPLIEKFQRDNQRQLRLLIEIKEDHKAVLPLVIKELKPLEQYFSYPGHPGRLSIVMTGAVPPAAELSNYPEWISFDVDHLDGFTPEQWKRIGLVSFPFGKYLKWNGKGVLNHEEIAKIKGGIDSVHNVGKKIRFWETP